MYTNPCDSAVRGSIHNFRYWCYHLYSSCSSAMEIQMILLAYRGSSLHLIHTQARSHYPPMQFNCLDRVRSCVEMGGHKYRGLPADLDRHGHSVLVDNSQSRSVQMCSRNSSNCFKLSTTRPHTHTQFWTVADSRCYATFQKLHEYGSFTNNQ
jgi:hypothetical protein